MKVKIPTETCRKCGYEWIPRKENIKVCPRCKSRDWNKKL